MTFDEALPLLKKGKKIRRAYWPKEVFLEMGELPYDGDYAVIETWTGDGGVAGPIGFPIAAPRFCESDTLEEDWEVCE